MCTTDFNLPVADEVVELPAPTACVARAQLPSISDQWLLKSISLQGTTYTVEQETSLWDLPSFVGEIFPFYDLPANVSVFLQPREQYDELVIYGELFGLRRIEVATPGSETWSVILDLDCSAIPSACLSYCDEHSAEMSKMLNWTSCESYCADIDTPKVTVPEQPVEDSICDYVSLEACESACTA
ncbi:MAG: hypothetical protein H6765_10445 [Candidatus Peribacteria bacterium]|nr:MAG: hypothetical protein H6765_10445 [Candidatus Peribacteria bacterium]